ncbi:uncharacterized protein [Cherax quadricarinatus]|uniref:uncharacterized protein n=1 Tax=Cherax quadricarinatus TaxID=27406 RepID=UPI00387E65F2
MRWPREHWATLLHTTLKGKAQSCTAALPYDKYADYEAVKKIILKEYDLLPESYQRTFRSLRRLPGQTWVEFARQKVALERWLRSSGCDTMERLMQLILQEEFQNSLTGDVRSFVIEHQTADVLASASLTDYFEITSQLTKEKGSREKARQFRKPCCLTSLRVRLVLEDQMVDIVSYRDTGSYLTLLRKGVLPLNDDTYINLDVLLEGYGGTITRVPLHKSSDFNRENLVKEQLEDPSLKQARDQALTEMEAEGKEECFYYSDGILMKKFPSTSANSCLKPKQLLVLPVRFRELALEVAHSSPMGGHLGIRKTRKISPIFLLAQDKGYRD